MSAEKRNKEILKSIGKKYKNFDENINAIILNYKKELENVGKEEETNKLIKEYKKFLQNDEGTMADMVKYLRKLSENKKYLTRKKNYNQVIRMTIGYLNAHYEYLKQREEYGSELNTTLVLILTLIKYEVDVKNRTFSILQNQLMHDIRTNPYIKLTKEQIKRIN